MFLNREYDQRYVMLLPMNMNADEVIPWTEVIRFFTMLVILAT